MEELFHKLALIGDVWVLYLLVAASVISIAVMIDRWRVFRKTKEKNFPDLMQKLEETLQKGDIAQALAVARSSRSIEARMAVLGLQNFAQGPDAVSEIMDAHFPQERQKLERFLIILGTLGNNAPFIGLFGTVLGVIKAFNDLAVSSGTSVSAVMAGVSSALIATAFGILVAIPAVMANNYFLSRIKVVISNCDSITSLLLAHLKNKNERR